MLGNACADISVVCSGQNTVTPQWAIVRGHPECRASGRASAVCDDAPISPTVRLWIGCVEGLPATGETS